MILTGRKWNLALTAAYSFQRTPVAAPGLAAAKEHASSYSSPLAAVPTVAAKDSSSCSDPAMEDTGCCSRPSCSGGACRPLSSWHSLPPEQQPVFSAAVAELEQFLPGLLGCAAASKPSVAPLSHS